MNRLKITAATIRSLKGQSPIAALTAYDFPTTKLLDEAGVPLILVGDSLGMVVLGYPDTTSVTMEDMIHHVRAAARAQPRGLLAADLPYRSYDHGADAVNNAQRLMAAGAEAVKAEGGCRILPQIQAMVAAGIPVMGHLGMLPQSVREEGGYKIKGKTDSERQDLIEDALALDQAGVFAIVLELVTPAVAADLTRRISVPTIGIGSGPACDGQILVSHDLFGTFPWFTPKFVKQTLRGATLMTQAVHDWMRSFHAQPVFARHPSPSSSPSP
jgi:3-methyl-2-oxobutanoate hydroxymethyltransferase